MKNEVEVEFCQRAGRFKYFILKIPENTKEGEEINLQKVPGGQSIRKIHAAVQAPLAKGLKQQISWDSEMPVLTLGASLKGPVTVLVVGE